MFHRLHAVNLLGGSDVRIVGNSGGDHAQLSHHMLDDHTSAHQAVAYLGDVLQVLHVDADNDAAGLRRRGL